MKNPVQRGLSLAEIMISMCLLSLILLSVVTIFPSGIESLKLSKNMAIASNIASKHLEEYKSDFYLIPDVASLGGIELYSADHFSIDPAIQIDNITFTPTVMINRITIGSEPPVDARQMLEVTVRVYWFQSRSIKKVVLDSYVFNRNYLPDSVPIY
jgi:hypothetical protein